MYVTGFISGKSVLTLSGTENNKIFLFQGVIPLNYLNGPLNGRGIKVASLIYGYERHELADIFLEQKNGRRP